MNTPLADRIRPTSLDEVVGQQHILGEGKALRKSHENPSIAKLYEEYLGEPNGHKAHELLHTHYYARDKY